YDTLKSGVPNTIKVFKELRQKGYEPLGIRLDSGDIAYLSKMARKMLDEAGFENAKICASGDMDEYLITSLKHQGAKIDIWGIGTKLITSADMPALGGVYKLSAVIENGKEIPKIKVSDNSVKITNPGFKGIYRIFDKETKKAEADLIHLRSEEIDFAKPLTVFHPIETWKKTTFTNYEVKELTVKVIENGKLIYNLPSVKEIALYAKESLSGFWDEYRRLDKPHLYKVDLSDGLFDLKKKMLRQVRGE
ncbi:MAG: nicotinate phosphoribosyltransferase, partial [Clostridia bacterium]|nr:nicotinate phosphoribosyltransferase [Clostridia bacterium]